MDITDALVVTLGLDPRNYQREIKNYRDDRKRLAEEDAKYNRTSEDAQKRMVQGVRTLRNETAGFLFMLAGANSVKDFAANLLTGDAATGRLARNLGMATEQVSAWEGVIKRVGGSAQDIQGSLRAMSSAFQSLQLTGTTGHDADFQGLGVTAKDLQNPQDALLKISEASSRMGRPEFNARLSRIGFDQNTINLLAKGRGEVTKLLEEQRKLGVATDADAAAAQRFQDRLAVLETAITAKARPAIEGLVSVVGDWLTKGDNLNTVLTVSTGILAAIGVAAAAAYWPFVLLAGAIAVVATNLDKIKAAWDGLDAWWKDLGKSSDSFFDPLRKKLGMKTGAEMREGNDQSEAAGGSFLNNSKPGGAGGGGNSKSIESFFKARGYTAAQARGITAGIIAESRGDPRAFNSAGGGEGAYGLGQWRGDRFKRLRARYGKNPTMQQQLEFLDWELKGGDAGGAAVRGAKSERDALSAYIGGPGWGFMRPDMAGRMGDLRRGSAWLGIKPGVNLAARGGSTSSTSQTTSVGQIVIYTAATDAEGIAHDMRGALAKRGLVVQANTGLQP